MKKILTNKLYTMATIAVGVVAVIVLIGLFFSNGKAKLDTKYIVSKLEKESELTTAKLTYEGFSKYTDEGIDILTKADFYMQYKAEVRAGIDVKDIKVETNALNNKVILTVPKARVLDVKIIPDSITYFNESFALFNWDSKEDANKAQKMAEEDATKKIEEMGLLDMADAQAEALIKGLVQDIVPRDTKIEVKKAK